jgi:aminopeptidase N
MMARCPGAITEVSPTETRCDFTHDGGPTYSTFGLAAYPAAAWTRTEKGTWGSAKVTLYDRPQTLINAAIDPAYHAGFMSFMESTFGPYPFGDELRVLTAPTYWSGFEHPGNIVLDDLLAKGTSSYLHPVAHVLDHEIAHMWAGNETTLADTYDFVWKEAMAEYLTYVYESTADPAAAAVTAGAWKSFSLGAAYFPVPLDRPALFDYYGDVYGPGPMVLFRQLEALTSRAQVIAALQTVLGQPRALSVTGLLAALEQHTGLDLDGYMGWIYGTGAPEWPRITLSYNIGGATDMLRVQQTAAPDRRCKFHVGLRGAGPGELVLVPVDTLRGGIDQTIPISPQPPFAVTALELDPLRECLVFPQLLAPAPRMNPWLSPRARE